jgi:hypothetical protein
LKHAIEWLVLQVKGMKTKIKDLEAGSGGGMGGLDSFNPASLLNNIVKGKGGSTPGGSGDGEIQLDTDNAQLQQIFK